MSCIFSGSPHLLEHINPIMLLSLCSTPSYKGGTEILLFLCSQPKTSEKCTLNGCQGSRISVPALPLSLVRAWTNGFLCLIYKMEAAILKAHDSSITFLWTTFQANHWNARPHLLFRTVLTLFTSFTDEEPERSARSQGPATCNSNVMICPYLLWTPKSRCIQPKMV